MKWQTVERDWPAFFGAIEQRWPKVDENDLIDTDGDRMRFTDYLAELYGMPRSDAHEEIAAWLMSEMPADVRMDEHRDNDNIRQSAREIPPGEDVYSEDGRFGSGDWNDEGPTNPLGRTK